MKFSTFVATFACVLGATLAFNEHKVAQAHSELLSYVNENMGGIKMMRGSSAHLVCYDDFIPNINNLANEAKKNSQTCVDTAEQTLGDAPATLQAARENLTAEIKKVQDQLAACVAKPGNLDFLQCLASSVSEEREILETVGVKSTELISHQGKLVHETEVKEQACIRKAVDDAKDKSDNEFTVLRNCLAFGRTSPAPEISSF